MLNEWHCFRKHGLSPVCIDWCHFRRLSHLYTWLRKSYHIISHISQLVIIPTLKEALSHYIIKALSHYIYIYHHVRYYPNSKSLITYHIYRSPLVIIPTLKKALSLYNQSLITFWHTVG